MPQPITGMAPTGIEAIRVPGLAMAIASAFRHMPATHSIVTIISMATAAIICIAKISAAVGNLSNGFAGKPQSKQNSFRSCLHERSPIASHVRKHPHFTNPYGDGETPLVIVAPGVEAAPKTKERT